MRKLLKVVGGIWAAIGAADIILAEYSLSSTTGGVTFALIFNMILFVIPGLILFAVGDRMQKPTAPPPPPVTAPYPQPPPLPPRQ